MDLIKIAEEQIQILVEIQFENVLEDTNSIEVSREIRNWCEFIRSLDNRKTAQEGQVQEQCINLNIEGLTSFDLNIHRDLLEQIQQHHHNGW